jgi:4-hydroxyphenylpyruvate dioxygenase
MLTSIATVSLSGDFAEKLEAIASAGFRGLEIFENDLLSFSGSNADARKMMEDLGLELVAFQPFRDFEGWDEPQRARAFARAERKLDIMEELGCELLMVCSSVSPDAHGGVDRAAEDFRELGERAKKRGMRVGFEALAWGRHINDYRDSWEVVRRADHPNIGVVLDSFHICARRTDLRPIRSIPKERIFLVQLADAPWLDMDIMQWSRHFRCFPGQGDLPVGQFMEALAATGYDGPLSLEIFNDQFRAGSARAVAVDGRRSLIHLIDETARNVPGAASGEPLPAKSKCLGVEFIEFTVEESGLPDLEGVFAGMGFHRAGKHVSKEVTRWTQGGINLVINAEKDGFAHSYQIAHGTSVCAIGLKVEDAAATLDRAERLLDKPFRQPVGPGELEIPAVRGLGGSLLYFLDPSSDLGRVWDIEFRPPVGNASAASGNAGLIGVDHISQSMQYEEMLSWLLFYSSLLDVEKTNMLDIADPGGLVSSQVIQDAGGALRIVLNGSQSQRTQSARFLSEFFGSGVQHIAFSSEDLVASVDRLVAGGVKLLPISENYYDDLEARLDLAPERLDALRARNILYDRDESGEYLQAYSQSFEEGFFFEFVERRGYKGFGAVNAPIRLAAQARLARHPAVPKR